MVQYRAMAEDALIAGAAAPTGTRLIRSAAVLDATWAAVVAAVLVASSFVPLIDLPNALLRTRDAPLRVYVLVGPLVAVAIAVLALLRRSMLLAAVATGVLVPAVALCGSLAGALFFDAASPFTDAGVPVALGAASLGIVMIVRWFVYLATPLTGVERRPTSRWARALLLVGMVLVVNVVVGALGDDPTWSASFFAATGFMLLAPLVVLAAAVARAVAASVVAATACIAQVVSVTVAMLDDGDVALASTLALRTGIVGLIALPVGAAVAIIGAREAEIEVEVPGDELDADDADWRWTVDEDL
jgi:hypothetical protein